MYVISGTGEVACLDISTGDIVWSLHGIETFQAECSPWGVAESPLIVDDKLIYTPGGNKTAVVALNKVTGDTVWMTKSVNDKSAYVSPILIKRNGHRLIVAATTNYVLGIDPVNGDIAWQYDYLDGHDYLKGANRNTHTNTPIFDAGFLYLTSGYNHGGILLRLSENLRRVSLAWTDPHMDCHHGGVVLVDGYLYGTNHITHTKGNWLCVDWKTGKRMYEKTWHTKGSLIYAEGMLYCFEERKGHVGLVKATPTDFKVISSFQVPKQSGPAWAHPVISDKKLYLRWDDVLRIYDISEGR